MGLVLFTGLFVGILAGLVVSAMLVAVMVYLTRKHISRRRHGWRNFGLGIALVMPLLWWAVYAYPWPTVRPGSDYDVALRNLFFSGLAYAAMPGLAVVVVSLAVLALLKENPSSPPPLDSQ